MDLVEEVFKALLDGDKLVPKTSVSKFAPQKMITFESEYKNSDKHLPNVPGRVWHEADINYKQGKRNGHRIVWSNDGLIFVTYDHYKTFYEIA